MRARKRRLHALDQCLLDLGGDGTGDFPVRTQEMAGIVLRHEAQLAHGRAARIDDEIRFDQTGVAGKGCAQRLTRLVLSNHPEKETARAEACDITGDIARAADQLFLPLDREHRHRRFRRDARDLAIDEVVEHPVADAEHGLLGNAGEKISEIEHQSCLANRLEPHR